MRLPNINQNQNIDPVQFSGCMLEACVCKNILTFDNPNYEYSWLELIKTKGLS